MSETATATAEQASGPDDSEPTPERQAELRTAYEANVAAAKPPYWEVIIQTLGELTWVLRERDWSGDVIILDNKQRPDLRGAELSSTVLRGIQLTAADLREAGLATAKLGGADLSFADLRGALLTSADLHGASLFHTRLRGADLRGADLRGADLRNSKLDGETVLAEARVGTGSDTWAVGDIDWGGADLTQIDWDGVTQLGDERYASRRDRTEFHRHVVRANRQVAAALRGQGMNEEADRFSYRAQVRQRGVLLRRFRIPQYLGSFFLDLISGYGYKPMRSFITYLLMIGAFAVAYFALGQTVGPQLSPVAALITSIVSFHGRGFFPQSISLDDPIMWLVASEAIIGLLVEITFIATFTQRFFAR